MHEPMTLRQLQKLLGIFNWFRKFIPNLKNKIAKLTDKLKGRGPKIMWDEKDERTKNEIFKEIEKGSILHQSDPNKELTLQTDASNIGIGGILLQEGKLVGIFSKKLNETEARYTIPEKEFYAIIKSLEHFEMYIWCSTTNIETDSQNISTQNFGETSRLKRWQILLNRYRVKIKHITGEKNHAADELSRNSSFMKLSQGRIEFSSIEEMNEYIKIKKPNEEEVERLKLEWDEEKEVYVDEKRRVFIHNDLAASYIEYLHKKLVHAGQTKLYQTLGKYVYIEGIKKKIAEICEQCEVCRRCKINTHKYGELKGFLHTQEPLEHICSDIFGPVEMGEEKVKIWFLTFLDRCTRWCEIRAIKQITAEEIKKQFLKG